MPLRSWHAIALAVLTAAAATQLSAGQGGPPVGVQVPSRDANGRPQIPAGTSVIFGMVSAADTSRPIRFARLTLSGTTAVVPAGGGPSLVGAAQARPGRAGGPAPAASTPAAPPGLSISRLAFTDAQGRFSFNALPSGRFTLDVSYDLYLPTSYGQKKPGRPGTLIEVAEGQRTEVNVPMLRGGVISGLAFDEFGDPLPRAQMRALRYVMQNSYRRLMPALQIEADDRGMYRLAGLNPGDYLVSVTPNNQSLAEMASVLSEMAMLEQIDRGLVAQRGGGAGPLTISLPRDGDAVLPNLEYAPTYFPAVTTPGRATAITLGAGEERSGVDIHVLPVHLGSIQGTVTGSTGPSVQVLLQGRDPLGEAPLLTASVRPDGRFTMNHVPPGEYLLHAQTILDPPAPTIVNGQRVVVPQQQGIDRLTPFDRMSARSVVTVDGQTPAIVAMTLQPNRSISGRVVFNMAQPPDLTKVQLTLSVIVAPQVPRLPAFNNNPQAVVDASGRFTLPSVRPGRYFIRAAGAGVMRSAIVNGEDTLDFALELGGDRDVTDVVITMTDRLGELSGSLTDATGKPAFEYTVVVAAADSRFWTPNSRRVMAMRPSPGGRFNFAGLPAGQYMLAAVYDLETGGQFDPEFLKQLVGASVRVAISEGGRHTQNVQVAQ